eukprot:TRINITY_DN75761_c0_g1_i1.p1 TRINITY_DN75761_c0_g1~~TRINITY_DN75761_c0_g1_i1.p1  ORF type:complete len:271 (-),score=-8.68 TRINITY_DN75761_c0_g1_i1:60-872(-)
MLEICGVDSPDIHICTLFNTLLSLLSHADCQGRPANKTCQPKPPLLGELSEHTPSTTDSPRRNLLNAFKTEEKEYILQTLVATLASSPSRSNTHFIRPDLIWRKEHFKQILPFDFYEPFITTWKLLNSRTSRTRLIQDNNKYGSFQLSPYFTLHLSLQYRPNKYPILELKATNTGRTAIIELHRVSLWQFGRLCAIGHCCGAELIFTGDGECWEFHHGQRALPYSYSNGFTQFSAEVMLTGHGETVVARLVGCVPIQKATEEQEEFTTGK